MLLDIFLLMKDNRFEGAIEWILFSCSPQKIILRYNSSKLPIQRHFQDSVSSFVYNTVATLAICQHLFAFSPFFPHFSFPLLVVSLALYSLTKHHINYIPENLSEDILV